MVWTCQVYFFLDLDHKLDAWHVGSFENQLTQPKFEIRFVKKKSCEIFYFIYFQNNIINRFPMSLCKWFFVQIFPYLFFWKFWKFWKNILIFINLGNFGNFRKLFGFFLQKKTNNVNTSIFFVFQSYELRFSGLFCQVLIRSFPGSFVFGLISGGVPTTTSDD